MIRKLLAPCQRAIAALLVQMETDEVALASVCSDLLFKQMLASVAHAAESSAARF
jgi:hypothetical protein